MLMYIFKTAFMQNVCCHGFALSGHFCCEITNKQIIITIDFEKALLRLVTLAFSLIFREDPHRTIVMCKGPDKH